jgi:hypothetical protein
MGVYFHGIVSIHGHEWRRVRLLFDPLKLQGSQFIWKIDQVSLRKTEKGQVVSGLNSVRLIEFTYRLEFNNESSIDNQIGSYVSDILSLVKDRDDTFSLVRDLAVPQGYLERTMVHGLAVPGT